MEFRVHEHKKNLSNYHKSDLDIAYAFSKDVYKECGELIKAIVLFGSTARDHPDSNKHADIDIMIILDDVHYQISAEVAESYKIITEKIILAISRRIHVTTIKLSTFWEYIRVGDPIGINILRDGVALLDTGFIDPLQALLRQGRIRPTEESIWQYFARAPVTLNNSRWHLLQATLDLYWAVIDASHAVLMYYNHIPPSPAHVAEMLQKVLVDEKKVMDKKHVATMDMFYKISKEITHRNIGDISGQQYEKYYAAAHDYIKTIEKIIDKTKGVRP